MKIPRLSRQRQRGMATLVMLAILSLMCLYLTANTRTLNRLQREIKLVDQHQQRRLAAWDATNTPSAREPLPAAKLPE